MYWNVKTLHRWWLLRWSLRINQISCHNVQMIGWLWPPTKVYSSWEPNDYQLLKIDLLVELWNETHRGKNYLRATWPRLIQALQVYNSILQDLAPYSPSPLGFCPSSGKSSAALSLRHLCWAATVYSFFSLVSSPVAPTWRLFVVLLPFICYSYFCLIPCCLHYWISNP